MTTSQRPTCRKPKVPEDVDLYWNGEAWRWKPCKVLFPISWAAGELAQADSEISLAEEQRMTLLSREPWRAKPREAEQLREYFKLRYISSQVERLRARLLYEPIDQIIYETFAASLGLGGSKTTAFLLAKRMPLADVRKYLSDEEILPAMVFVANMRPTSDAQWNIPENVRALFEDRKLPCTPVWGHGRIECYDIPRAMGRWLKMYRLSPSAWVKGGCRMDWAGTDYEMRRRFEIEPLPLVFSEFIWNGGRP